MTVDVSATGAAFQAGVPKQLFALLPNVGDWDMTADGKRFLAAVPPGQQTTVTPITVVRLANSASHSRRTIAHSLEKSGG